MFAPLKMMKSNFNQDSPHPIQNPFESKQEQEKRQDAADKIEQGWNEAKSGMLLDEDAYGLTPFSLIPA